MTTQTQVRSTEEALSIEDTLKLALDALENHTAIKHPQQIHYRDKAINAIKEALAQPEPEPVAWFTATPIEGNGNRVLYEQVSKQYNGTPDTIPLYTTPYVATPRPQRTWVGLTDEEYDEIWRMDLNNKELMNKTIAKLKEKNFS